MEIDVHFLTRQSLGYALELNLPIHSVERRFKVPDPVLHSNLLHRAYLQDELRTSEDSAADSTESRGRRCVASLSLQRDSALRP
jgi:hypothetical protein